MITVYNKTMMIMVYLQKYVFILMPFNDITKYAKNVLQVSLLIFSETNRIEYKILELGSDFSCDFEETQR